MINLHSTSSSLDVLVNCAGILVCGAVDSHSTEDFDRVMKLNTRSSSRPRLRCRYASSLML